jgi:hypothetical protein
MAKIKKEKYEDNFRHLWLVTDLMMIFPHDEWHLATGKAFSLDLYRNGTHQLAVLGNSEGMEVFELVPSDLTRPEGLALLASCNMHGVELIECTDLGDSVACPECRAAEATDG